MNKYFVTALTLGLVLALAACGGSPAAAPTTAAPTTATPTAAPPATAPAATSAPSTGGQVQLQFWHGQSQTQEKALQKLIQEFEQSHPNIQVTETYQGNYSDLFKKVTAAIAANSPPDLAIGYQEDVVNYIKSDAVIPLDDLMNDPQIGFTAADMKDVFPAFIDHYTDYGNKVYSIAFMRSMEVMYYNQDILKAAGFSNPPASWDDFLKVCQAVSKPPDVYCYEMTPSTSTFANWVWSRGGDMASADGKSVAFDQQPGLDSMNFINTLFTNKYAILTAKSFQDQTDFSLGKIAFTFGSTAGLPYYASAIKGAGKVTNWDIAPDPHTTANPVVDLYGPSVAIFKTTPEKEHAAFTFLKWLMDTGPNAEWVQATSYFPARQSTKDALASFISSNPRYGEAFGWLQYGRTEPIGAAWETIRTFVEDGMTAVADGKATPAAALKTAADKANQAIQSQ